MSCRTRDLTVDVLTHSDARLAFGKQQHFSLKRLVKTVYIAGSNCTVKAV